MQERVELGVSLVLQWFKDLLGSCGHNGPTIPNNVTMGTILTLTDGPLEDIVNLSYCTVWRQSRWVQSTDGAQPWDWPSGSKGPLLSSSLPLPQGSPTAQLLRSLLKFSFHTVRLVEAVSIHPSLLQDFCRGLCSGSGFFRWDPGP